MNAVKFVIKCVVASVIFIGVEHGIYKIREQMQKTDNADAE